MGLINKVDMRKNMPEEDVLVVAISGYNPSTDGDHGQGGEGEDAPGISAQLTFKCNDKFKLIGRDVSWWLYVESLQTQQQGYVPSSLVVPFRKDLSVEESRDRDLGHGAELSPDLINHIVNLKFFPGAPGERDKNNRALCPEDKANFLSKITFWWMNRLLITGFKRPLVDEDLWALNEKNKASHMVPKIDCIYTDETRKCHRIVSELQGFELSDEVLVKPQKTTQKQPSLAKSLVKEFWGPILIAGVLKVFSDLAVFLNPYLLELIISYTEDSSIAEWKGYLYATAMFAVIIIQSLVHHQHFRIMLTVGMRIHTCVIGLVYRKTLLLNSAAKKMTTAGEMVNLMSVDAHRLMSTMTFISTLWSSPLQIILAFYFLYQTMGVSVLAGVGVLVLLIPLSYVLSKLIAGFQNKQMIEKDARIKIMNEVLAGIKILKLYAWEESFLKKITDIRDAELKHIRNSSLVNCVIDFTFICVPFTVSFATFAIYVHMGNELTASKAFVTISLLNFLEAPLILLPMNIVSTIEAAVSIKRLTDFLNLEELDPESVQRQMPDHLSTRSVHVQDGTFSWGRRETSILKSINLNIPSGSLVAIVGQVGCGKSSLLSALLGEMEKLGGQVYVQGSVGYVSQQPWIQNATMKDNILFGRMFMPKRYCKVVDACALRVDFDILPAGDQTEIGDRGINLSGGQKQRVSLARAVYFDADVYLLDDPLSAVDSHVGKHIFDRVIGPRGLLKEKTRILVTHGIKYLPHVDQIIVLHDGRISEVGTYQELVANKGTFADFLKIYANEGQEDEVINEEEGEQEEPVMGSLKRQDSNALRTEISSSDLSLGPGRMRSCTDAKDRSRTASVAKHDYHLMRSLKRQDSQLLMTEIASSQLSLDTIEIVSSLKNESLLFNDEKGADKMIKKEKSKTGVVNFAVFLTYAKSLGIVPVIFIFLFFVTQEGLKIGSRFWLAKWSSDNVTASGQRDMYLGIYGSLGFSQAVIFFVAYLIMAVAAVVASRNLHKHMLINILHSGMEFFETTPLGRIINRFSKDMLTIDDVMPRDLMSFLEDFFNIVGTLLAISIATPIFLLVIVPLGVLYAIVQRAYVATSRQLTRIESVTRSPIYSHFFESINGSSTIRAFRLQSRFVRENYCRTDENHAAYYPSVAASRWIALRVEFVGGCVILFAALFAVISRNSIATGLVGLSITYALQITNALGYMVQKASELESNIVSVERVKEYSEVPTEAEWIKPDNRPPDNWPDEGRIHINEFDLRYREGLPLVLKNVGCVINPGEKIGIVGRTGAGKSSLTLALFRILESAGGRIVIDDIDISRIGLKDLRSRLTIIPQDPVLFSGTLRLNLDPFDKYSDEDLWHVLDLSQLKTFVSGLEGGLQHIVSEGGENISVGQRQLVCLARALLRKSKILVLDEATAAVDLETDEFIQKTIRREFADKTVLTIAHRLNTIMDYTKIMVLDQGFIVEFDTPANLLARQGIFYGMAHVEGLA